ncbi:unnamed protein product [Owenia fusiformis]|uniref:Exportin-2 n=1 Tax=Owenia fusiformis TaxID=6347 RepID=A0A8S4N2C6_OWEFU|nr:unnamed protein product [Owenia fusiformis]
MEVNEGNLQTLGGYLEKTLSVDFAERKNAEKFLESIEGNQNYPILLLHLIDKPDCADPIRVSASIMFKNYVKRNWRVIEDSGDKIHANDRVAIKQFIVGLMLKSPEHIQKQFSDAISNIGREDFPDKWPELLGEMVSKFQSGDTHVINGVLRTAHSIFKRYRHEFKSQKLWTEIKYVLDNFAAPLTQLFNDTMERANQNASNLAALKIIFSSLVLICKIFYSLNFQDLPEYFEDNMGTWMGHFHSLLLIDNKLLQTHEDEEAGLLEQVKSQICDNVGLYAQKYDEEFSAHLPTFVTDIWNLLVSTGQQVKYDLLVTNAINFLTSVAERPGYKHLFDPSTLSSICEKVIVPNMQFREADEEGFEDNPEEYIRRDIEGSDVDTRRRAACDLVRALSKQFEGPVIENFSQYVESNLALYQQNPAANWKHKDVAVYLVTTLAAKAQTQKHGITQTSSLVNLQDFFNSQIVPDLQNENVNERPILKADALKYVMTFRNQLPNDITIACIPLIIKHLLANSVVQHSYAAHGLERMFMLKNPQGQPAVTRAHIQPHVEQLLTNLFAAMSKPESRENEYIMKAVMRTISLLGEGILPYVGTLVPQLTQTIIAVSKNPSKPHFNHYLFESLCVCIRNTCKASPEAVTSFEQNLFPPFQEILQQDVQEFIPYVFQILSLLLEMHTTSIPDPYMALFPFLLTPVLWERPGNIPPLVRLLQAYVEKGPGQIETEQIGGLLGIFQKLIASKSNDHEGFYLLNSMLQHMPVEVMAQYLKRVFMLLFQRLTSSKTTKFIKSLLVFFCLYIAKHGTGSLVEMIDAIQPKMFGMVLDRLFISEVQKVSGHTERKICAVGMTNILTETPALMTGDYQNLWTPLLQALIGLFELPEDESIPDDEHFIEIEETPGYQTAYSQLMFAGKKDTDPFSTIPNAKIYLANKLHQLSTANPGKIPALISARLEPNASTFLQKYLQAANVTLS